MLGLASFQFVGLWLMAVAVYILLAGEISATELAAGSSLAGLIVIFLILQRRVVRRRYSPAVPLKAFVRPISALLPDAVRVGKILLASLFHPGMTGHLLQQPFTEGTTTPEDVSRRAVAVLGISLAPNAFAICQQKDALLLHCLHPRQATPDPKWPA
jgi:hypothetical protein